MLSRVIIAACLLFALPAAHAEDKTTMLKVQVFTLSGKPVDRASVVVDIDRGRSLVKLGKKTITHWELRTNQEGLAKMPSLPQGSTVIVRVIAKGFQTYGEKFELTEPEKTVTVKLNPPQQPYSAHQ